MDIPAKPAPTTTASKTAPTSMGRSGRVLVSAFMFVPFSLGRFQRSQIGPEVHCDICSKGTPRLHGRIVAAAANGTYGGAIPRRGPHDYTARSRHRPDHCAAPTAQSRNDDAA